MSKRPASVPLLPTPSSDREIIQLMFPRTTSQSRAHEKRDMMTPSVQISVASRQHCANSHTDFGQRHYKRQGMPSSRFCPPHCRRRRCCDWLYRLVTGMIARCPVGHLEHAFELIRHPASRSKCPPSASPAWTTNDPSSSSMPSLDRELARQSLPSPALSRAHEKRATTRSSVLIVVAVVDDRVLGPSGLFTLTGRISYQLVQVSLAA